MLPFFFSGVLGGSSQLGSVVNNHGDPVRPPRISVLWDPFQMGTVHDVHGLYKWGVTNVSYYIAGIIFQVVACQLNYIELDPKS